MWVSDGILVAIKRDNTVMSVPLLFFLFVCVCVYGGRGGGERREWVYIGKKVGDGVCVLVGMVCSGHIRENIYGYI